MRHWIIPATLVLAVLHYVSLTATSSHRMVLLGPLFLYALLKLLTFLKSRKPAAWLQTIKEIVSLLLMLTTVTDLILNIIPYEPHLDARHNYRALQFIVLYALPIITVFLPYRWKPLLLPAGLIAQMIPPYNYSMAVAFNSPVYGKTTAFLYLAMLLPFDRGKRIHKNYAIFFLLFVLAGIPAVFLGQSPMNAAEHVLQLGLFIFSALLLSRRIQSQPGRDRLIVMLTILSGVQLTFVLFYPELHAVNSNITSILLETMLFLCLYIFQKSCSRKAYLWLCSALVIGLVLMAQVRMDANTGLLATIFGLIFLAGLRLAVPRIPTGLRLPLVLAFAAIGVGAAAAYMLFFGSSHTVLARRLLWEASIAGILSSPLNLLFGTGDFGPFHFFLFRHLTRALTPSDLQVMAREPKLVAEHPHNDYLMMSYGGGIVYLALYLILIFFVFRRITKKLGALETSIGGAIFALLFHGINEPSTSGALAGFLFWLLTSWILILDRSSIIIERPKQIRFSALFPLLRGTTTLLLSLISFLFIVGAFLQLPSTLFWESNFDLFQALRASDPTTALRTIPDERQNKLREELPFIINSLNRANVLFPWATDMYRQEGDLLALEGHMAREKKMSEELYAQSESFYCHAFALRSSPIHFLGIVRSRKARGLALDEACQAFPESHVMNYDPHKFLEGRSF